MLLYFLLSYQELRHNCKWYDCALLSNFQTSFSYYSSSSCLCFHSLLEVPSSLHQPMEEIFYSSMPNRKKRNDAAEKNERLLAGLSWCSQKNVNHDMFTRQNEKKEWDFFHPFFVLDYINLINFYEVFYYHNLFN